MLVHRNGVILLFSVVYKHALILVGILLFFDFGEKIAAQPIPVKCEPLSLETIRVRGFLGERIDSCIVNRINAQDLSALVTPFRNRTEERWWQMEFWGKCFLGAVEAYRYTRNPNLGNMLHRSVAELFATQSPDGYIGNYSKAARLQNWDIWGRKYTLLGLLAYYDLTKDRKTLRAAIKLADHTIDELGPGKTNIVLTGNFRGMASSSILEPMVRLYTLTGSKRYLDFAEQIVSQWESTKDGPRLISNALADIDVAKRFPLPEKWWSWENGLKAYEMMSCYDGLLGLYQVTGNDKYLKTVQKAVQNILDTEINILGSGTSVECWYGGRLHQTHQARHFMETCVTMTWMKLCFHLYCVTGEAKWVDELETSIYNALLAAMSRDGSLFTKYTPLIGIRQEGEEQCNMGLNCCVANGPRAVMLIPQIALLTDSDGLIINLFAELEAKIQWNGMRIGLQQITDYPEDGLIEIVIHSPKKSEFAIKVRIPRFSPSAEIRINNELVAQNPGTGYWTIRRQWQEGDRIELKLDDRVRIIRPPDGKDQFFALQRGPVVLARDQRFGAVDEDEILSPVLDREGYLAMEPLHPDKTWMLYSGYFLIGSDFERERHKPVAVPFCDFISAGNTWSDESRYRVWIPRLLDPSRDRQ